MSNNNLNELLNKARALAETQVIFSGRFINFTPWWGGNYEGKVLEIVGDQAYINLPEAKSIIGKTIWFLRTATGDGFLKDLGIIENYTGESTAKRQRSKLSVIVRGEPIKVDLKTGNNIANQRKALYLSLNDFQKLDKSMDQIKHKSVKLCQQNNYEPADFISIFCIPRVLMRVRELLDKVYKVYNNNSRKIDVIAQLPVKPNTVSFTIEVRAEPGYGSNINSINFIKALLFTLYYLGIGSGANRGFGRFKPLEIMKSPQDLDISPDSIINYFSNYERHDSFPSFNGSLRITLGNVGSVETALKCIGDATTKMIWKQNHSQPIKSCGANLNTWVLGLPRQGKDKDKIERFNKCSNESIKISGINKEYLDKLIDYDADYVKVVSGYSFFKELDPVRRQSYIVLSVNENNKNNENKGSYIVNVFKFIPDSLDTTVLSGGYFIGLHRHPPRNKNNCGIEVKDVLNQNNKPISINDLNNLIDNAINEIKSYLNKCTNGGYGRIGQSQGRYNTRIGGS
ncbi:MAG: hypothetical protein RXR16_04010 [Thermocladium sp.]